jgi:16S rRNA processing protein RimM
VPREAMPPLADDEIYQQDLVGFAVRNEADEPLGIVSAVYDLPAGATIEVQGPEREFLLPYRTEYVKQMDREGRRLVVSVPAGLID